MNKNLSLNMKLLMLCSFLLSISAIVGGTSYYFSKNTSETYQFIIDKVVPKTKLGYEMMVSYRQVRINLRTLGLQGLSRADAEAAVTNALAGIEGYEKAEAEYVALGFVPGQKEIFDKMQNAWLDFKAVGQHVLALEKSGTQEDREKMLSIFLKECPEKAKVFTEAVTNLLAFHNDVLHKRDAAADEAAEFGNHIALMIILAGLFAGLGVGFLMARNITRAIGTVAKDLALGSEQVAQASTQIAGSSQSLSGAATEQASSLEETVATMEELTSMVRMNSENGKQAAALAVSTREIAVKGEGEIKTLIDSIHSISADSKKIEEITTVIDDIAFQTNLLALNAAVEAARAGEQGKGFAVVAEAVRNLAQRSSLAAKDIAELIKNSVEKIEQGSRQANQSGVVFAEIVNSVKKVADLNNEIASASEEQSNGIAQIGKAMNQMDQVTQQNAAAAEETAAAAEELSAQSENLKGNVGVLESVVYGSRGGSAPMVNNVVPLKKAEPTKVKAKPKSLGAATIPFGDEDASPRRVTGTDGF